MKYFINILILLISIIPEMFSQTSLEFTFNQNQISLSIDESITKDIHVYNGQISEDQLSNATPILGKTIKTEEKLQFVPLIPFGWNQEYTLVYDHTINYFTIPIPEDYDFLSITAIYPSSTVLPANLLKWYVRFSRPINKSLIYNHIRFINADGDTLSRAILPLKNALISDDGTLLTAWVEPGRQKRGLGPNKQLGPVFNENENYTLIISKGIKDNTGISMQEDLVHPFLITKEDRIKPEIDTWKINTPKANSLSPLQIQCNESLDYGSSLDGLAIIDSNNREVIGNWQLLNNETLLVFKPTMPWNKDTYQIIVDSSIEDLAGNNLNRLFDNEINSYFNTESLIRDYKLEVSIK